MAVDGAQIVADRPSAHTRRRGRRLRPSDPIPEVTASQDGGCNQAWMDFKAAGLCLPRYSVRDDVLVANFQPISPSHWAAVAVPAPRGGDRTSGRRGARHPWEG